MLRAPMFRIGVIAALLAAAPALADTPAAVAAGQEVAAEAQAAIGGLDTVWDNRIEASLEHFAATAEAASVALRAPGEPEDLACIYAGMAKDARAKAAELAAAAPGDRGDVRARIAALLNDAVLVAPDNPNGNGAGLSDAAPPMSCPALKVQAGFEPYFTLHP